MALDIVVESDFEYIKGWQPRQVLGLYLTLLHQRSSRNFNAADSTKLQTAYDTLMGMYLPDKVRFYQRISPPFKETYFKTFLEISRH